MNEKETQGFDVPEINEITNQKGIIPADSVTTDQKLAIPNVNLANSAPDANQALTEASAQVESQTKLDELTNQRIADTQSQRTEQEKLISLLGEQGTEIQTAFQKGQEALKPIEKEVMDLTSLINTKTQAIQNQLIDEAGRRIPQAFITGRQALIQQRGTAELSALGGLLDAKNGQLELAQNKIDRSLNILREVNATEIAQKEAKVALRKEITGESKEEEENELTRLKEEQAKFEKERDEISAIALQSMQAGAGAGEITAITNAKSKDEAIAAAKSLGRMARIDAAIKSAQLDSLRAAAKASGAGEGKLQLPNGKVVDEAAYTRAKSLLSVANSIKNHPAKKRATGTSSIINVATLPGTERKDFINLTKQLLADLTLENTGRLKGAISEKELAIAQSAASALDVKSTEQEFDRQLDIIINTFSDNIGQPPPLTVTDGGIQIPSSDVSNEEFFN